MSTREAAITALMSLITNAYAWNSTPSRRLRLWGDIPNSARPTAFLFEGGHETYSWASQNVNPKRVAEIKLFVYIDAHAPNSVGATQLNNIRDAIDAALAPSGAGAIFGRQTGGGTAFQFRIEGQVLIDPGDIDGDGMMVIPIRVVYP